MVALPGEARFLTSPTGLTSPFLHFPHTIGKKRPAPGAVFRRLPHFPEGTKAAYVPSSKNLHLPHVVPVPRQRLRPPRRHHAGQQPHLRSARLAATTAATGNATSGHRKNRHRFRAPRRRLRHKADRRPALRPPTVGYLRATPFRSSARRHPFLHRQTSPYRRFRFHPPAKQRRPPPTEPSSRPRRTSAS